MQVGLPLSGGGFREEDPGGGCLEEVGVAVRPEPPVLTLPGRPNSRARCGRGTYLPSLEDQMEEKEVVRPSPGLGSGFYQGGQQTGFWVRSLECTRNQTLEALLSDSYLLVGPMAPGLVLSSLSRTTELYLSSSVRPSSFSRDAWRRCCRLLSISLARRAARTSRWR